MERSGCANKNFNEKQVCTFSKAHAMYIPSVIMRLKNRGSVLRSAPQILLRNKYYSSS
jgi:hypothetical protein